mmetsp:Transcript_12909/g.26175  ORF Transcript_12909/g.26175 Transcript_12909/m.26175 type:complete len:80 (+) Transcript_12909:1905-2144(+)
MRRQTAVLQSVFVRAECLVVMWGFSMPLHPASPPNASFCVTRVMEKFTNGNCATSIGESLTMSSHWTRSDSITRPEQQC